MDKIISVDWRGGKEESSLQEYIHARLDGEYDGGRIEALQMRFDNLLGNTSKIIALICEKTNIPIEDIAELIGNEYDGKFKYKGKNI